MPSKNVYEHMKHIHEILTTSGDPVVRLKTTKFHFYQRQAEYLGYMVKTGQLEIKRPISNLHTKPNPLQTKNTTEIVTWSVYFIPDIHRLRPWNGTPSH